MPNRPSSNALAPRCRLDIGGVVAHRYRVEAWLGSGGSGSVFRGQDIHTKKSVAIKALHRELPAESALRFEKEALALASIDHPNVVKVIEVGRLEDGSRFLVFDYIAGQSLAQTLAREGALAEERSVHITREVLLALTAAHHARVVHRDLKPENIMVGKPSGETRDPRRPECVHLLDFGIAKFFNVDALRDADILEQADPPGDVLGTPDYMSPEQAAGNATDHRSDLYSLGAVTYRMLVGHTPFRGDNPLLVLTRQLVLPAPALPQHFSAELRAIVARLLEKEPENRFQSAQEVLARIDALLAQY